MQKCVREYLCSKLAKDLGQNQVELYFRIYRTKRTVKNLVELYLSVKGEQSFIENYLNTDSLYVEDGGFLERFAQSDGSVTIYHRGKVIAQGYV